MARRLSLALAALGLAACSTILAPTPPGAPHDPDAEMRPVLIVAEPVRVAPGDVLSLTFPEETMRGVHFVLETQARGTWFHTFDLVAVGEGMLEPEFWSVAGSDGNVVPDIGIVGPGPDRVRIPDVAEPGTWRICTGNAGQNFCTAIEIADG